MRLLITTDNVGGVWTYSLDLARGLSALGVDVVLATMGSPLSDSQREAAESADVAALHESEFRLEWMDDAWRDVDAAGEWLLELAREESVDVIHSCSYSHGALRWQRPVVVVAHSCVFSWWRAVHHSRPVGWSEYHRRVGAGLRTADAVVAPTNAMLSDLSQDYGIPAGIVIHNGSAVPESDHVKGEFVFAAGRMWDQAKGLDVLGAAARHLEWLVLAAGTGAEPARGLVALGPLPHAEVVRLQQRAPIFCEPARYEPFGLAILEAARGACALVIGDVPSLRELWGDAAVFVDPGDHEALRAELGRLIANPVERKRLGRAARRRSRRFTVERMAKSYLQLYRRLQEQASPKEIAA